jgi:ATP-dependent protease HslVU (ClpYQ) peptidase subunit
MTILVAVKKNGQIFLGADRMTTSGSEYATDLVNGSKLIKLKHAYLATSGYTLLDNVVEHLYDKRHKMMENTFKNRAEVFQFFLEFFAELKKTYTLVDHGKETYAGLYNVFLLVTPKSIYGVSANLSVHEFDRFAAKGAGADYSLGCLYGIYDLIDDAQELTRLGLEAACHFSIYCKEPLDIVEVKAADFGKISSDGYKAKGKGVVTHAIRKGAPHLIAISRDKLHVAQKQSGSAPAASNGNRSATTKTRAKAAAKTKVRASAAAARTVAAKAPAKKTATAAAKRTVKTAGNKASGTKARAKKR